MDKKPTHRNTSGGNLRRPHWIKTLTVWCCLLLRVAAFLASAYTGRPCTSFVVERVPPQGAPYMGAQRYQAQRLVVSCGNSPSWSLMKASNMALTEKLRSSACSDSNPSSSGQATRNKRHLEAAAFAKGLGGLRCLSNYLLKGYKYLVIMIIYIKPGGLNWFHQKEK